MTSTPWGGRIFHREVTGSTMDDAQVLEDRGEPDGSLVWADFQTSGRGRTSGRIWVGAPGASLLFTVFWKPDWFVVPEFAPSLTVGLGICRWIESLPLPESPTVTLKWPNDVYLNGRKVAGILVRRRWTASGVGAVHAGIGINLLPAEGGDFRSPTAAISDGGLTLGPREALESLMPFLAGALACPDPRSACDGRLWKKGAELTVVLPGDDPRTGIVTGLDRAGGLILSTTEGQENLMSGE